MKFSVVITCVGFAACAAPGESMPPFDSGVDVPDATGDATGDTPSGDAPDTRDTGQALVCVPDARRCEGTSIARCRSDGVGFEIIAECGPDGICGDGACRACVPSQTRCSLAGVVETCDDASAWVATEDCTHAGLACLAGRCKSPCERDAKANDNSGCDYWAVDMDNHPDAQNGPFAVIVSNLSMMTAMVKVTSKDLPQSLPAVAVERPVAPGDLAILNLPNRNMGGAGTFWSAYRIESTAPIVAYQFNPLANVGVFSNDASLLVPSDVFGHEYFVMSRFELVGAGANQEDRIIYRSMFSVVAVEAETHVTVTPTCITQVGFAMPVMAPGIPYTYTIDPYQVLNVKSAQNACDLTGTLVTSDRPVGVFGGHEAALTRNLCCADHLEQQLFPVSTWGSSYIATKAKARQAEVDYWRVVAATDGTVVSFAPAVTAPRTLARGEWFEVPTRDDFVISATNPVSVAQTLASSYEVVVPEPYADCTQTQICATGYKCERYGQSDDAACFPPRCNPYDYECPVGHTCTPVSGSVAVCTPVGDPALIMIPPVHQWRKEYVFLTPNAYAEDYVNIVAPADASVILDGSLVADDKFDYIETSGWKVARVSVRDGTHRLYGDRPISAIVYGYDRDVSYGYAAGLNLVADE